MLTLASNPQKQVFKEVTVAQASIFKRLLKSRLPNLSIVTIGRRCYLARYVLRIWLVFVKARIDSIVIFRLARVMTKISPLIVNISKKSASFFTNAVRALTHHML